jgi:hypothetical protein
VRHGSPEGRDADSVHDRPSPKGHASTPGRISQKRRSCYEDFSMGMTDDDDTVYCDIQMPVAEGRELLQLVNTLRDSNSTRAWTKFSSRCSTSSALQSISLKTRHPGAHGGDASLKTCTQTASKQHIVRSNWATLAVSSGPCTTSR